MLSGGDVHTAGAGTVAMAGMAFPYRVRTGKEFVDGIRRGDAQCIINGQIVETVSEESLSEVKRRTV